MSGSLSEVRLQITIPETLAGRLREMADRDCSSLAATVRRLIARSLAREAAAGPVPRGGTSVRAATSGNAVREADGQRRGHHRHGCER